MKNNLSFNSSLSKFGIGLFETIKVKDGIAIDLNTHIDRMLNSITCLDLNINYEKRFLIDEIIKYIKKENIINKALRITVFDEGYNISIREIPYNKEAYNKGFKLTISPIVRGDSLIYRHKTTNYFENIYTKNIANKNGYNDGIFINSDGVILECSMSNIFFIRGSKVYTPSSKLPILNGTIKKRIIKICDELHIELMENEINISEISSFDFVFVTNSLMGAMKVTEIDKTEFGKENIIFNKIIECL
ncbi:MULTISPECIES: aminotransferase class IV [unclassified Clostridioides]|uniref:aminotransferase class IV n=1 Tax=unclassified Clostridioides TaxID=2635829 RepID=UPI001D0C52E3|nr:aminotransferase class IV [Clostridioides sp. ES-S-0001-02]MCC0651941.1 aminotransferase class IV [Clostridioides sp. ES-S-0001-03]MCC0657745.1 aminotransferase class IV [Clostridioides sp. ES-S-0123-01]MCC0671215.1 aminotransferase class IV [Clostridioides sp. ES-S-0145-01]MCC0679021.1 aminotransferase class IV [Clostridioides sp. ES-S-0005-03]MCC0694321.1 aminotransferase class IV [Clostridioides sp. ES-S-0048-02]MCC0703508.1 aminotransferase class IV [Clostridioides sp. ES-S-0049-02]MC